jgi:hypothetical protein
MEPEVSLHVDDDNLKAILNWMQEGRYRIPEFQRDYVWEAGDVTDLLDSIYNQYPVGSIFLWEVSEDKEDFFRNVRDLDQPPVRETGHQISFVLDGQQRLLSLYNSLMGEEFEGYDYSRVLFDIDNKSFTLGKPTSDHLVRVCDIWDMDRRYEIKEPLDTQRSKAIDTCAQRLENYKIPLLEIGSDDVDKVIEIFERINQKGRDLDRFDIVNANIWSKDFNLRRRIDEDINTPLEESGFGAVERQTVTQALSLAIQESCTTTKQKDLRGDDVADVWTDVKDAFNHAIRYIRKQYNIRRVEFLPYEGLIAVLSYYLYKNDTDTVSNSHQQVIDRWFWRVIVSDHWESTRQTRMGEDAAMLNSLIDGGNPEIDYPVTITPDKLVSGNIKRSKSKVRNAFLCILASKQPRNLEDGTTIDLGNPLYSKFNLKNIIFFRIPT